MGCPAMPRSVTARDEHRIERVDAIGYGHGAVRRVQLDVSIRHVVLEAAGNQTHTDTQVMGASAQEEASANGRPVLAGLVTGEDPVTHVVGCWGRVLEGLCREFAGGINPPGAVAARLAAIRAFAADNGHHLVIGSRLSNVRDGASLHWATLRCERQSRIVGPKVFIT